MVLPTQSYYCIVIIRNMKWQKNFAQTHIPQAAERVLNETKISDLLDKDFKIKIINMLTELQNNIQELREDFKKE